jgi:hypothetical protein
MQYAFVVQFAADTTLAAEDMQGRIEHLMSGQATQFQSIEALRGFVTAILQDVAAAEKA